MDQTNNSGGPVFVTSTTTRTGVISVAVLFSLTGHADALSSEAIEYKTILYTGQQYLGPDPGVIDSFGSTTWFSDSGHIALRSRLERPDANSPSGIKSDAVILKVSDNEIKVIAQQYDPAEGIPGAIYNYLDSIAISNLGEVTFSSNLDGVPSGTRHAIFTESTFDSSVPLAPVFQIGSDVSGSNYIFSNRATSFLKSTDAGVVAFRAEVGPRGVQGSEYGIFTDSYLQVQPTTIAISDDPVPPGGLGVQIGYMDNYAINNSGRVAFASNEFGSSSSNNNIFAKLDLGFVHLARQGESVPVIGPDVFYAGQLSEPDISDTGHVVFRAVIYGNSIRNTNSPNNTVLVLVTPDGIQSKIVQRDDLVPTYQDGTRFGLQTDRPRMNDAGETLFWNEMIGPSGGEGIFIRRTNGAIDLLARTGDTVVSSDPGLTLADTQVDFFFNNNAELAFVGKLSGPGIDATNEQAVVARLINGDIVLVAKPGDMVDLNSDPAVEDLREILYIADIKGLNNHGQLVYRAVFENNEQALVVASLPVPEPNSISLLGSLLIITLRRRRREGRNRCQEPYWSCN